MRLGPAVAQSLHRHVQADLVPVFEAVGHFSLNHPARPLLHINIGLTTKSGWPRRPRLNERRLNGMRNSFKYTDNRTVYTLHFTGERDKLLTMENEMDSIA